MVPAPSVGEAAAGPSEEQMTQARELNAAHSAAQAALAAELEVARRQRADADERAAALEAQARPPWKPVLKKALLLFGTPLSLHVGNALHNSVMQVCVCLGYHDLCTTTTWDTAL